MPELWGLLIGVPGLVWILLTSLVAGVVYGFAGFGAALIFMPVATIFISVELAIASFSVSALASFVTVVPGAWQVAERKAVVVMIIVASCTIPIGLWILRTNDVTVMRWAVLGVTAGTLVALIAGWRYQTRPSVAARVSVAGATGVVGGATGLVGPIMVLFQLSGQDSIERSRANTLCFLTLTSLITLPLMWLQGMIGPEALVLGAAMLLPYGFGAWLGKLAFHPGYDSLYRRVAYGIVLVAILLGLPIWEG
jgi:uncharacterized membrane protein YfcA